MTEIVDVAFDGFVSARLASWINGRIGDGQWNSASLAGPQLDREVSPDVIVDDRGRWFRPAFTIVENDPAFGFAVRQTTEVDDDGDPFNRGTLTLTLNATKPSGLGGDATQVPNLDMAVNLTVPTTAADGTTVPNRVHGGVSAGPGNTFIVTFDLLGAVVNAAYVHLTQQDPDVPGGLVLQVIASHAGVQPASTWPSHLDLPVPWPLAPVSVDLPGPAFNGFQFMVVGPGGQRVGAIPELPDPFGGQVPSSVRFLPIVARYDRTVELGLAFHTDEYRSRFTITRDGMTRPIIDANDLSEFAGPRSEYRELTSLGPVSAKYPSLQRLYFGQVSGTVVAVPKAYGIQRTSLGLAASCDAVVDAAGITGSRFHFTFDVAPMADPVELARLAADVVNIPEAAGRTLRVILPPGLDSRGSSTLDGFPSARPGFADGTGSAVQVSVDIADDETIPATTLVNQFLHQLGIKTPAPLFGNLALRLDDLFVQPVVARLVLSLHQTADGDELSAVASQDGTAGVVVSNDGPFDLALQKLAIVDGADVAVSDLGGQILKTGQTTSLAGDATNATELVVSRRLPVPLPVPKASLLDYVTFHTIDVQKIQQPLNVNATGINFAVTGITAIRIQIALTDLPAVAVPELTLSAGHPIDFVHALVPIESAFTGLQATVALTITSATGVREVSLSHDFIDEPILVLTEAGIA